MSDQTAITIYCPATGLFNTFCRVDVIDPQDSTDGRFTVVGAQARHPSELTVIFRTSEEIIADVQSTLLSAGGLWLQHGHSFQRACINNGL